MTVECILSCFTVYSLYLSREVVVDPEGGDVPTPTGGRDQDKSQATKPAHISSTGEENSSCGRNARDGKQGSISGSLKKKLGEFVGFV